MHDAGSKTLLAMLSTLIRLRLSLQFWIIALRHQLAVSARCDSVL